MEDVEPPPVFNAHDGLAYRAVIGRCRPQRDLGAPPERWNEVFGPYRSHLPLEPAIIAQGSPVVPATGAGQGHDYFAEFAAKSAQGLGCRPRGRFNFHSASLLTRAHIPTACRS